MPVHLFHGVCIAVLSHGVCIALLDPVLVHCIYLTAHATTSTHSMLDTADQVMVTTGGTGPPRYREDDAIHDSSCSFKSRSGLDDPCGMAQFFAGTSGASTSGATCVNKLENDEQKGADAGSRGAALDHKLSVMVSLLTRVLAALEACDKVPDLSSQVPTSATLLSSEAQYSGPEGPGLYDAAHVKVPDLSSQVPSPAAARMKEAKLAAVEACDKVPDLSSQVPTSASPLSSEAQYLGPEGPGLYDAAHVKVDPT